MTSRIDITSHAFKDFFKGMTNKDMIEQLKLDKSLSNDIPTSTPKTLPPMPKHPKVA